MIRLRLDATCIAALCLIGWSNAARGQDEGAVMKITNRSGSDEGTIVIPLHEIESIRFNPCEDIVIRLSNGTERHADLGTYGTLKFIPCDVNNGARGMPQASAPNAPAGIATGLSLTLFPNPTAASLSIEITSDRRDVGSVAIYDLEGNLVWRRDAIDIPAGTTRIVWGGTTSEGAAVSSGTYIVRASASGRDVVQHVTVTK